MLTSQASPHLDVEFSAASSFITYAQKSYCLVNRAITDRHFLQMYSRIGKKYLKPKLMHFEFSSKERTSFILSCTSNWKSYEINARKETNILWFLVRIVYIPFPVISKPSRSSLSTYKSELLKWHDGVFIHEGNFLNGQNRKNQ